MFKTQVGILLLAATAGSCSMGSGDERYSDSKSNGIPIVTPPIDSAGAVGIAVQLIASPEIPPEELRV
jgi:hypothetical protein